MKAARLMEDKIPLIAVSNTFTRKWEYLSYLDIAATFGYQVIEIVVKSSFTSEHNVPLEVIEKMRERWEN